MGFAVPMVRKYLLYAARADQVVEITGHGLFMTLFDGERTLDGRDTEDYVNKNAIDSHSFILDQWDEIG